MDIILCKEKTNSRQTQSGKNNLIDLKTDLGKQRTKKPTKNNSVLLMGKRDKFRDDIKFIEQEMLHKKEFGKWIVIKASRIKI